MPHAQPDTRTGRIVCRAPMLTDGPRMHALVDASPPLEPNSTYSYLLLATHFAETCAVAEQDDRILGFVSAYRKPAEPSVLFVWQVAVDPEARGRGVAGRLLSSLLTRPACAGVRYVETTVSPSNEPSRALFRSVAAEWGAALHRRPGFQPRDFGPERHEAEELIRIGPFDRQRSRT